MGWTYTNRQRGTSHDTWFKREFADATKTEDGHGLLKVMGGQPGSRAVYGAYRTHDGKVIAIVCLINWIPNPAEYYNFGYKDMEESMGPCEHDCPEGILKMLTPIEELHGTFGEHSWQWAKEWREKAWARVSAAKARKPLKSGALVTFKYEISFTDGYKSKTLQVADPKRLTFAPPGTHYGWYKIKRRNLADIVEVTYPA
jgi:hypothetical protein